LADLFVISNFEGAENLSKTVKMMDSQYMTVKACWIEHRHIFDKI